MDPCWNVSNSRQKAGVKAAVAVAVGRVGSGGRQSARFNADTYTVNPQKYIRWTTMGTKLFLAGYQMTV